LERLRAIWRLTNSAGIAVASRCATSVSAAAKYSCPLSSLSPWQEKCRKSSSSRPRSLKNVAIRRRSVASV
jgi:hypothetical protein